MRLSKNDKTFIDTVKNMCKKHKISCKFKDVSYLKPTPKIRCTGYFDDESRTLEVAMKQKDSLELIVHEYCHLTQWVDKAPVYTKASKYLIALDKWIEGKNLPIEVVDAAIKGIVDLELDNEKRAVAMIRKYNLNIDKDKYIKKANAYLYFYHWMKETRRWSRSSNIPYKNKVIIDAMPITFRGSYDKLPNRFKKLYKQENI